MKLIRFVIFDNKLWKIQNGRQNIYIYGEFLFKRLFLLIWTRYIYWVKVYRSDQYLLLKTLETEKPQLTEYIDRALSNLVFVSGGGRNSTLISQNR